MTYPNHSGIRGLMAAVIAQALRDACSPDTEKMLDAVEWLEFESPAWLDALDLPPDGALLADLALAGMGKELTDRRGLLRY